MKRCVLLLLVGSFLCTVAPAEAKKPDLRRHVPLVERLVTEATADPGFPTAQCEAKSATRASCTIASYAIDDTGYNPDGSVAWDDTYYSWSRATVRLRRGRWLIIEVPDFEFRHRVRWPTSAAGT